MKTNHRGDDLFLDRLFSYLNEYFSFPIHSLKRLRNQVYFVESTQGPFILKGFSSYHRFRLQETFTASLKKEGFTNTYSFLNLVENDVLFFDQTCYGCLEYIPPSSQPFSYINEQDRYDGLELLHQFHQATGKISVRYQTLIGYFKMIDKWRERTEKFLDNTPIVRFFITREMISEMVKWANWSLKGLEKTLHSSTKREKVILHGDVAHHNFLRSTDQRLFLLDFDLISIGEASFDYLQYANRILPFLDWSLEELTKLERMKPYLNESAFLYALAYPADIFREWNRLIRERHYTDPSKVRPILDLSVAQFNEREKFFQELKKLIRSD